MRTWQVFVTPLGTCAVPAATEAAARRVLAREAWNGLAPSWPWQCAVDR